VTLVKFKHPEFTDACWHEARKAYSDILHLVPGENLLQAYEQKSAGGRYWQFIVDGKTAECWWSKGLWFVRVLVTQELLENQAAADLRDEVRERLFRYFAEL